MRLNSVVLPAPFGPIRLVTLPGSIDRSTAFTATSPPNRMVTPRASSSGGPFAPASAIASATPAGAASESIGNLDRLLVELGPPLAAGEDALWPQHHHEHE